MKALQSEHFEDMTAEESAKVNGGLLGSLNPAISGAIADISATAVATLAGVGMTVTDLTTNLDSALGTGGTGLGSLGGSLGGNLLGGNLLGGLTGGGGVNL